MEPSPARRLLDLLAGHWTIDRRIDPGGRFTGSAAFTRRSADSLLYRESGCLVLPDGTVLNGSNSYIYAIGENGIEISFADGLRKGGHFIDIAVPDDHVAGAAIVSADRHLCRLDTYDATFGLEDRDRFTVTYVVKGPTKGYVSRTTYRRLEGSTAVPGRPGFTSGPSERR